MSTEDLVEDQDGAPLPSDQQKHLQEFNRLNNENVQIAKWLAGYNYPLDQVASDRFTMFIDLMRTMIPAEVWNDFEMRWAQHLNERLRNARDEVNNVIKQQESQAARAKLLGPTGRPLHTKTR